MRKLKNFDSLLRSFLTLSLVSCSFTLVVVFVEEHTQFRISQM